MIVESSVLALENTAQLCYQLAVHTSCQQWGSLIVPHPPTVDGVMYMECSGPNKCGVIPHDFNSMCPSSAQFSSVAQSCLTLCDPMNCSMPGFPVYQQLPELVQTHVHQVSDAIQPSHPLSSPSPLLPPSIFPSIRVFSNESVPLIRWPKYWSCNFNWFPLGLTDFISLQF